MTRFFRPPRGSRQLIPAWKFFLVLTPFMLAFAFFASWAAHDLYMCWRASDWTPCPATIVEAGLQSNQGRRRTTYKATARYRYEFQGKTYEGDRIAIFGGSDSGGFPHRVARKLKQAQLEGTPVLCYVNPQQPSESLLVRNLRLSLLCFQAVFAIGTALAVRGILRASCPAWPWRRGFDRRLMTLR